MWWKLRKGELDKLMDEESHCSQTDLTVIRWSWLRQYPKPKLTEEDIAFEKAQPIRNHGLFSKAEKALAAAGWSERARRDFEVVPLTGTDVLPLILLALNAPLALEAETVQLGEQDGSADSRVPPPAGLNSAP